MWIVIKEVFVPTPPMIVGGKKHGVNKMVIDRVVETLDDVKSGETFFKCNVKA